MKSYKTISAFILAVALIFCLTMAYSCKEKRSQTGERIIVSIAPLKYIVEAITCGDFNIDILLPEGASPETYSPTPKQIAGLENSLFLFTTGLIDFENELISKVDKSLISKGNRIISLSKGITLLSGTCSHSHIEGHSHSHGIDPHVWTSPKQLKIMALNAYNAISNAYPDSVKYAIAYRQLDEEIEALSEWAAVTLKVSGVDKFIIYHPALTYYANDYGLEQIAVENEGKEPSAVHMKSIIDEARNAGITSVMYQKEFPRSVVELVARELDADIIEINPLAEDIVSELRLITNVITSNHQKQ